MAFDYRVNRKVCGEKKCNYSKTLEYRLNFFLVNLMPKFWPFLLAPIIWPIFHLNWAHQSIFGDSCFSLSSLLFIIFFSFFPSNFVIFLIKLTIAFVKKLNQSKIYLKMPTFVKKIQPGTEGEQGKKSEIENQKFPKHCLCDQNHMEVGQIVGTNKKCPTLGHKINQKKIQPVF